MIREDYPQKHEQHANNDDRRTVRRVSLEQARSVALAQPAPSYMIE
jgi:hypothetical protein